MFSFRNIDNFIPSRFERMGLLKGKRWYIDKEKSASGLFKPKRQEFGDKKVFCGNHYGEVMGYLLTLGTELPACKSELAHLSKYYENIHKERNHGTSQEKDGCITYSNLEQGEELEHGKNIVEFFTLHYSELFEMLSKNDPKKDFAIDNLEVILAAMEKRIREFYAFKSDITDSKIEEKIILSRKRAIQMIVYDCLYGNNDRHDENWAMRRTPQDIEMYPIYDNERVLGLYENQTLIENALNTNKVEQISEEVLFSRMRVPGEQNKNSNYKDVLKYLMEHYREETEEALIMFLSQNTPEKVSQYLNKFEGLPKCYVDFGTIMYKSRYDFARELCNIKTSIRVTQDKYSMALVGSALDGTARSTFSNNSSIQCFDKKVEENPSFSDGR